MVHMDFPKPARRRRSSERYPAAYAWLDDLSGWWLLAITVFAPWALACTVPWAIWTVCAGGYVMGALWVAKLLYLRSQSFDPGGSRDGRASPWPMRVLWTVAFLLLTWSLTSALNWRSAVEFVDGQPELTYREAVAWLPQSFDRPASQKGFWRYLALALIFGSARHWFLGKSRHERHSSDAASTMPGLPARLRLWLWIVCGSGALLSLVSVVQRADGTDRLLWLVPMREGSEKNLAFGPFSYRANAAQYFNLIWPICLGFWWAGRKATIEQGPNVRLGGGAHAMLIPCLAIMFLAPLLSASRGGVLVLAALAIPALAVLAVSGGRAGRWATVGGGLVFLLSIGLGWILGGDLLAERFRTIFTDHGSGRSQIYVTAHRMLDDFRWLGSGPETFSTLFGFYRRSAEDVWAGYAHNDYLEMQITFGTVGLAAMVTLLGCIPWQVFRGTGIRVWWPFPAFVGLSLLGLLTHARADFPFQMFILQLFFVLACAVLTVLRPTLR